MRNKRAKAYSKLLAQYERHFGFRQPYQVLLDDSFVLCAHKQKMDVQKALDTVMRGSTKLMITQCAMQALYVLGNEFQPAVDLAKTCERRKCNHKEAKPVEECVRDVVGETNKHRYAVATLDPKLRKALRVIPGVPTVHVNRAVLVLEPPSDTTTRHIALLEVGKTGQSKEEKEALAAPAPTAAPATDGAAPEKTEAEEKPRKNRKGPKGPNPLSMKKKQKKPPAPAPAGEGKVEVGKKRKEREEEGAGGGGGDGREERGGEGEGGEKKRKRRRRKKGGAAGEDGGGAGNED